MPLATPQCPLTPPRLVRRNAIAPHIEPPGAPKKKTTRFLTRDPDDPKR